jgi:hypothetical protein
MRISGILLMLWPVICITEVRFWQGFFSSPSLCPDHLWFLLPWYSLRKRLELETVTGYECMEIYRLSLTVGG